MGRREKPLAEKLTRYVVEQTTGCWLWTGHVNPCTGYGHCWSGHDGKYRFYYAHRLVYETTVGKIPEKTFVLHSCDVPRCVNPDHLRLGTQTDNMADRRARGRENSLKGQDHPRAKLDPPAVRHIRLREMSSRKYASMYNVSQSAISAVQRGTKWQHVQ